MDLRYSPFEILTACGAFFVCLFFVTVFTVAPGIEESVAHRVADAVKRENLFWTSVEASGQRILLTGAAPDFASRKKAGEIAQQIDGVTDVVNEIAVIGEAGTCQRKFDEYLNKERITFKSGSDDLSDSSLPLLNMLAAIARGCNAKLEIAAHTDGRGDAEINLKLSQRRADAVARYLVRSGVTAGQVAATGYGENQPVADNETEAGREANRRVEIRVLGGTT